MAETVKRLFINLDETHYSKLKILNKILYKGNLKDGTFAKILLYDKIDQECKTNEKVLYSGGVLCENLPLFEETGGTVQKPKNRKIRANNK